MKIDENAIPAYGEYYGSGEDVQLAAGYSAIIKLRYDECAGAPWENCDGHGPVSDWTNRAKAPGERVLAQDRSMRRYYDYAEAIRMAKRDGWDAPPYGTGTKGERVARAVDRDFKYLQDWCNDRWHYVGVIVKVYRNGEFVADESLWGVVDCGDYWRETAAELIAGIIETDKRERIAGRAAARQEKRERDYWVCRDVVTV